MKRKEKSIIEKLLSELKKIINKKDECSIEECVDILKDISVNNQDVFLSKLQKMTNKRNKFMNNLSSRFARLEPDYFIDDVAAEVIDYCFRFGDDDVQRNGVLILSNYSKNTKLVDRYRFVFLKDKKAEKLLKEKVYKGE